MTEDRTTMLERQRVRADDRPERKPERRRPDETAMWWGALFFFGLGLYAAAFVTLGVLLSP